MKTINENHRQRGMSLIELMIAMTIGIFIVGGALAVFVTASGSRRTNDEISRMQENARFALNVIKPDIRLAGYWGLTKELGVIEGHAGATTPLGTIAGDCATRWYIDLENAVAATNDANPYSATCLVAAEYRNDTDIVIVRHAEPVASAALTAGEIYIRSDAGHGELFQGSAPPTTTYSAAVEDHRLQVHAYYIRPYSFQAGDGIPSLRRMILTIDGTTTEIDDEEVIPGIEDLQVQFGVDTDDDGSINQYLNPDSGALAGTEILAVRIWIMARATNIEAGFTDASTYTYASKSVTPNDSFRRLLVTSTIELRNLQPTEF